MKSKSERTKQFIIEKTAPIFNIKGYAGTSMNDLTQATGLTKGSIYGNFENKDDVALAAFDYNFQCVVNYLKTQMEKENTYFEKLLVYPKTYRNYLKLAFLSSGCPIANTATEADDTHPKLKEKAIAALTLWRNSVERLVQFGIETNEFKSDINVLEVVTLITGLIQGSTLHAKVSGEQQFLDTAMDYLEKAIMNLRI